MNVIGAQRALIINSNLVGGRCWGDRAPENATMPYVILYDGISFGRELTGDGGKADRLVRQTQASLFQRLDTEDTDLAGALYALLHTARLPADQGALSLRVDGMERISEPGNNTVQHAVTLSVRQHYTGL